MDGRMEGWMEKMNIGLDARWKNKEKKEKN